MYFFKKKISSCLYIFFIFLTFNFIEFSTKEVLAKTFVVSKIEVEEKYNLSFNKLKVMDRGFKKAFQDISQMILERKDLDKIRNTPINDIKKLINENVKSHLTNALAYSRNTRKCQEMEDLKLVLSQQKKHHLQIQEPLQ